MKASAFAYARATSVANALELLAAHGEKAKVLSGGQSLMPAMNLRLISPELIVDIGELAELRGIAVKGGVLTIGALTRHVDLLKSAGNCSPCALADGCGRPCRASCDPQPRHHRGQPCACGSSFRTAGLHAHAWTQPSSFADQAASGGSRRSEFFTGIYETALSPQELLVAVELPVAPKNSDAFLP